MTETSTQQVAVEPQASEQTTAEAKPRRAMLSVYDKTGVVELAAALHAIGWVLLSSGGTAKAIDEAGIPVTDVADMTGVPAILGHRVVTLHPKVHGGILADRSDPAHHADMEEYDIEGIDLVVVNLYPFADEPSTEKIDIGGPAMVRAAGKNNQFVGVVVDPADYEVVAKELRDRGELTLPTRARLATKAFEATSAYDARVATWQRGFEKFIRDHPNQAEGKLREQYAAMTIAEAQKEREEDQLPAGAQKAVGGMNSK